MKSKKIVLLMTVFFLSLTLMGCPSIENQTPEIVQLVDGEIVDINQVIYEHVRGNNFHPDDIIQNLINEQNIIGIDYDQSKWIIGKDRNYTDISDRFVISSFDAIWEEGEDANFDGIVDDDDKEFYGSTKTDEEGNIVLDAGIIMLIEFILPIGNEMSFVMTVADDDGASTEITGTIVIVAPSEE
ncbi:hypothetical protein RJI07_05675 [Mycoplasmatota bacterium WC30]